MPGRHDTNRGPQAMSEVIRRVRKVNPVPRSSHLVLDREEFRDLVEEHRDGLAPGWAAGTTVHGGPRWQVALVTFAFVLVAGGGALLAGSTIGADTNGTAAAGTSEEQMAIRSASRFFDALSSGDPEAAAALMEPDVFRNPKVRPGLQFLSALPGTKSLSDCRATKRINWIDVVCNITFSGPLFVATGVDTKRGVLTVGEDGLITSKPTLGRRLEADSAFVEYAIAIEPEAFLQSCDPDSYRPGTVETSKLSESLAWTGECGELWSELSRDAAAWVYAGKPPLESDANAKRDPDSS